jgi:hypothetical protein
MRGSSRTTPMRPPQSGSFLMDTILGGPKNQDEEDDAGDAFNNNNNNNDNNNNSSSKKLNMDFSKYTFQDDKPTALDSPYTVLVSHAQRSAMDHRDKEAYFKSVMTGLKHPIRAPNSKELTSNPAKFLNDIANQYANRQSLVRAVHENDATNSFLKFETIDGPNGQWRPDEHTEPTVSILSNFKDVSEEDVIRSANIIMQCGTPEQKEDLMLFKHKFLASIENKTRATIERRIASFNKISADSALMVWYLINKIMFAEDPETIHHVTSIIRKLTLQDYDGENVDRFAYQLLAAMHYLEQFNAVPPDVPTVIFKAFQKCTVSSFQAHFSTLKSIADPRINDAHALLTEGKKLYDAMRLEGTWTASSHKVGSSTFHYEKSQANNNSRHQENKNTSTTSTNGNGQNQPRFPLDSTPPKSGASTTRKRSDGKTENWCTRPGCCLKEGPQARPGLWTTHEDSDESHKSRMDWLDKRKAERKQRAAKNKKNKANNATSDSNGTQGSGSLAVGSHPLLNLPPAVPAPWYFF